MKTADARSRDNLTHLGRLDGPVIRSVLLESEMGAVRCKCTVEEGGIRYSGKVYTSLSGAAMAAARDLDLKNKIQNGFFFFRQGTALA